MVSLKIWTQSIASYIEKFQKYNKGFIGQDSGPNMLI